MALLSSCSKQNGSEGTFNVQRELKNIEGVNPPPFQKSPSYLWIRIYLKKRARFMSSNLVKKKSPPYWWKKIWFVPSDLWIKIYLIKLFHEHMGRIFAVQKKRHILNMMGKRTLIRNHVKHSKFVFWEK